MYFMDVGDAQLSHQEPPHADAGLHRCINFLEWPVDSEAATGCELALQVRPEEVTRRSAELVCLEGRQTV